MLSGFLICSLMLIFISYLTLGGLFLVFFYGLSMMTDSPKFSPKDNDQLSISLMVSFFLQSPFLIWERSKSSLFFACYLKTSLILQSPMGVSHYGHQLPIIILIFYYEEVQFEMSGVVRQQRINRSFVELAAFAHVSLRCGDMDSLYCIHSTSLIQSLNFYVLPALPRTTTITPPSKQPTNESPPYMLLPVLPPRHPYDSNLFVFSNKQALCMTSPSSLTSLGRIICLPDELILQNKGILKHYDASLATSKAELIFPVMPCGFVNELSANCISFAYFDIRPTKTAILTSLFSLGISKQLKYRFTFFFKMKLPKLLAIVSAILLAEVIMSANRAYYSVIMVYSSGDRFTLVPPIRLSGIVTKRSNVLILMKYSLTISYAVQKVSSLEMDATA